MRGKPGIFGLATGLAVVGAVALGSAQAATRRCTTGTGTTLASNSKARVYSSATGHTVWVCLRSNGHERLLDGALAGASHFALAGTWVAWTSNVAPYGQVVVHVMHITNGAIPYSFPWGLDYGGSVNKVVVKSDGAAAWAATPSQECSPSSGCYPPIPYVEGTDYASTPDLLYNPDLLSVLNDPVEPGTLVSDAGHKISWHYEDGSTGTAELY